MTRGTSSLARAMLTLLAGGLLAQALPLLLGPWLTRLYLPQDFGVYHLFAAVAANVAVVACARYEFALPMVSDDDEAVALRALCRRVLAGVVLLSLAAAMVWAWWIKAAWPLWLPVAVATLGGLSLASMVATRAQAFARLAKARVLQHGGGALLQALAGVLQVGLAGLIIGPVLAAAAAWAWLSRGGQMARRRLAVPWRQVAGRYRDFPLLNTPHAFLGALQDTLAVALIAASLGPAAAGAWGLALRYLKAPATLVGTALSQALYPRLAALADAAGPSLPPGAGRVVSLAPNAAARSLVRRCMLLLALAALPLVGLLWLQGPALFAWVFGPAWAEAGELARALALYIGLHFIASPLGVVTLAWNAQAWALKVALAGQVVFVLALGAGLAWGGLASAGWAVSVAMALYFGLYFWRLANWPLAGGQA